MKHLIILGAGTAGTILANRVQRDLPPDWRLTVVDPSGSHLYQPGLLLVPFGEADMELLARPRASTLDGGITWVQEAVQSLDTGARRVRLANGESLPYDLLVCATGTRPHFDAMAGQAEGRKAGLIHDFYTVQGARHLRRALAGFAGGRLVVTMPDVPVKAPMAAVELLFLADHFFRSWGARDRIELLYTTPLDQLLPQPRARRLLGDLLREKDIRVVRELAPFEVDVQARTLRACDGRQIEYDLLVTVPAEAGPAWVGRSGLGNDFGLIRTDPRTLRAQGHDRIFALGDGTDLPKLGTVAHAQAGRLADSLIGLLAGRGAPASDQPEVTSYLLDPGEDGSLSMSVDPEGDLIVRSAGDQDRMNHVGKRASRWLYWNAMLPGAQLASSFRDAMPTLLPPAERRPNRTGLVGLVERLGRALGLDERAA